MTTKTIPELLKAFWKQPGCEAFKGDSKQIELVSLYLLLRQLTPTLPFEVFLEKFTQLADADEQNLKLPDVAVNTHLPRSAAKSKELGVVQWSAKQVIGFLALYVDMIREAEASGTPVPLTLNQWIGNTTLRKQYLDGAFDVVDEVAADPPAVVADAATDTTAESVPAVVKKRAPRKTKKVDKESSTRPTGAHQRIVYAHPSGQHIRGVTEKVEMVESHDGFKQYVTFTDDSGQRHDGVAIGSVRLIEDPSPQPPQNVSPEAMVIRETIAISLEPEEVTMCTTWLQAKDPGKHEPGMVLWEWSDIVTQEGVEYTLYIKLLNADEKSGAYVDAYAVYAESADNQETVVFELVPRNFALLGAYMFVLPHGTVKVSIEKETEAVPA